MSKQSSTDSLKQNSAATNQRKQKVSSSKKKSIKADPRQNIVVRLLDSEDDPRIKELKTYPLSEIILSVFVGILYDEKNYYRIFYTCGCKISALRKIYPFSNGMPPHYVMYKAMQIMDSKQLEYIFGIVMSKVYETLKGERMEIGKDIARMVDNYSKYIMASACVGGNSITIVHEIADKDKTVSTPEILKILRLNKATVTMDGFGWQGETANVIAERGGNYVICLHDQQRIYNDVKLFVHHAKPDDEYIEKEDQAEQSKTTHYKIFTKPDKALKSYGWSNLKTVVCMEVSTNHNGMAATETKYFLSSLDVDARDHSIIIDDLYRIDECEHNPSDNFAEGGQFIQRKGHSYQSYAVLRKLANACKKKFFPQGTSLFEMKLKTFLDDNVLYDLIMSYQTPYELEQLCTEYAQFQARKKRQ